MPSSPPVFQNLIGQQHAVRFLTSVINQGQASHAYMFPGPPGVGKLQAAVKLAAALCCESQIGRAHV